MWPQRPQGACGVTREVVVDLGTLAAYDFVLPEGQIAAVPAEERDGSRLLVVGPAGCEDRCFRDLVAMVRPGDLLVVNDVAVQAARVFVERVSGGRVELLFLDALSAVQATYRCMMRSRRTVRVGEVLRLALADGGHLSLELVGRCAEGYVEVRFLDGAAGAVALEGVGELPLPPYIQKRRRALGVPEYGGEDAERYQTVYARAGAAVAAPTAGLHFTHGLLAALKAQGVEIATLRLDVGLGTFQPVRETDLSRHVMHAESYHIDAALVAAVAATRRRGGRVVAVGTTVVRALEDQAQRFGELREGCWETRIFIRPGHVFGGVDVMVTNFHLPQSTLLMLVCAFGGYARVMAAYAHAVAAGYRFFSYGDAMLLFPEGVA